MSKLAQLYRIVDAEKRLLVGLYGSKVDDTLNVLRFQLFTQSPMKNNLNLTSLQLKLETVRQHCLRTYLLALMWLDQVLNPMNWGWLAVKHGLALITTTKDPAPQSLLMALFYNYAKGCISTCRCRKSGIKCSGNCANFKEHSRSNAPPETDEKMLLLSEDDKDQMTLKKREIY
ncbi:hypothetical protein AVEN_75831-1 [Araneus ventricosus]|uniref:Uncharacterized protein n=1 Tax=Araneus ventricosus TaxID=182803 RepID=A0A4Y2JJD2_ARAVE|nr:hypothetical protein AVEN_75831-1 [Araneus ventricosus]